jgi:hypothetical protein
MKRIFLVSLLVLLLLSINGNAAINHLSNSDRKLMLDEASFKPLKSKNDLPTSVVFLCADFKGRLADIGGRWEPSDYITDDKLPQKRLVWAAASGKYYVVHYERGGIGHSFHILLAKKDGNETVAVWRAVGDKYSNIAAFIKSLKNGQMEDDPKYAH